MGGQDVKEGGEYIRERWISEKRIETQVSKRK